MLKTSLLQPNEIRSIMHRLGSSALSLPYTIFAKVKHCAIHPAETKGRLKARVVSHLTSTGVSRAKKYLIHKLVNWMTDPDSTFDEDITSAVLKELEGSAGNFLLPVAGGTAARVAMNHSGLHDKIKENIAPYVKALRQELLCKNSEEVNKKLEQIVNASIGVVTYRGSNKTPIDKPLFNDTRRAKEHEVLEEHFKAVMQDLIFTALSRYLHNRLHEWVADGTTTMDAPWLTGQVAGLFTWNAIIYSPEFIQDLIECAIFDYRVPSRERKANAIELLKTYYGKQESVKVNKYEGVTSAKLARQYVWEKGASQAVKGTVLMLKPPLSSQAKEEIRASFFKRTILYIKETRALKAIRPIFAKATNFIYEGYFWLEVRIIDYFLNKEMEKQLAELEKAFFSKEKNNEIDVALGNALANIPLQQVLYPSYKNYYAAELFFNMTGLEAFFIHLMSNGLSEYEFATTAVKTAGDVTPFLPERVQKIVAPLAPHTKNLFLNGLSGIVYSARQTLTDVELEKAIWDQSECILKEDDIVSELLAAQKEVIVMQMLEAALQEALPEMVKHLLNSNEQAGVLGHLSGMPLNIAINLLVAKLKPTLLQGIEKRLFKKEVLAKSRLEKGKELYAALKGKSPEDISPMSLYLNKQKQQLEKEATKLLSAVYDKIKINAERGKKALTEKLDAVKQQAGEQGQVIVEGIQNEAREIVKNLREEAEFVFDEALKDTTFTLIEAYGIRNELIEKFQKKNTQLLIETESFFEQLSLEKAQKVAKKGAVFTGLAYFNVLGEVMKVFQPFFAPELDDQF